MSSFKTGGIGGEPIPTVSCDMAKFFALADPHLRRCLESSKEYPTHKAAARARRRSEQQAAMRVLREATPDIFGWSPRSRCYPQDGR